jgi:CheY-like chemotaxis protein
VLEATDGFEGLEMARNKGPNLIILNALLPKMEGYKVAGLLKFDRRYRDIPIVVINSGALPEEVKRGFATRFDASLANPFVLDELLKTLTKLLG